MALTFAAGSGGAFGGSVASSVGTTSEPTLMRNLNAKKTNARNAARRGDITAWRRLGLRSLKNEAERYATCVTNAVGHIREFLTHTPCRRLDRPLLALADNDKNVAVVAVSWVELRSRTHARKFQHLYNRHGTGHVKPIGGAALAIADGQLTGQHYASRLAGPVTVTAEAEPVTGQFDDHALEAIAEIATWSPRP